jgi:plastocyanin
MTMLAGAMGLAAMPTTGEVWAGGEVTVTREENKPPTVEIKVGEEVRFVNASGSTAHVWFAGNDAIRFYAERPGARVKFEKLGTYEYTVHVTAGAPRAGWVLGFVRDTRALPERGRAGAPIHLGCTKRSAAVKDPVCGMDVTPD